MAATKKAVKDPVSVLLNQVQKLGTEYFIDGDDFPCILIRDDPFQREWRLRDVNGKPEERIRSWLRSQYHYATEEKEHLSTSDLEIALDYLTEEAYKGGRKNTAAKVEKDGDYNFEAVVVFAGGLTKDHPSVVYDDKARVLLYEAKTSELWRAIDEPAIEAQVTRADKDTLYKAINFFSRRLTELTEQFRKEGLEVTISHKEDGSWVTIIRRDNVFLPGPVLVTPDDKRPSSSGLASGDNSRNGKQLEKTDGTDIEIEPGKKEEAA